MNLGQSKISQKINSTSKNDSFLHYSEHKQEMPQKYVNKDRNLKPITNDFRKVIQDQDFDDISNQSKIKRSSLYEKLNIQGDSSYKNQLNDSFQQQSTHANSFYSNNNNNISKLNKVKIHDSLNTTYQDIHATKLDDIRISQNHTLDNTLGFANNQDYQIIKQVQGVLQKKEKNHQNIKKMLFDQRQMVGNLLRKYKKNSTEQERIIKQKMRELEHLKNNYTNLKQNEETLSTLYSQITIRLDDYKQNQQNIQKDVESKNYMEGIMIDQNSKQKLQFLMNKSAFLNNNNNHNSSVKKKGHFERKSESVNKINRKRWDDQTYKGKYDSISQFRQSRAYTNISRQQSNTKPDFQF